MQRARGQDPDQLELVPPSMPEAELPPGGRCRSFVFLERGGERWTVFLVTYPTAADWRGYFAFRPASAGAQAAEIRTADLFVEMGDAEIGTRARGLGRPLLSALLDSALQTFERRRGFSADSRRWFRQLLARHSAALLPAVGAAESAPSLAHLRSVYESYRLDQVAHLIALTAPKDFQAFVNRVLEGRPIDFAARDRLQLAMLVIQELEGLLPLPSFEVWVEDYLANQDEYQRYTHALHYGAERGGDDGI